ncbi:MAG: asparagine synthase (glutamine-hydrolyzing) [Ignavibacteriae bacterium]|nr:asparagine synthase (glutamine-hydrolyzing) [Ignavibacteriota bacterium]
MCGIAGIVSFRDKVDSHLINKMTDVIKYRGPDDEGALAVDTEKRTVKTFKRADELENDFKRCNIFLGHRRLSIIDLTDTGHQPMGYANDTLWITYNGEIYNYVELKRELAGFGYKFKSNTDTEVILAAYHKWGYACLKKFNGMWSFAILDISKEVIFCSTDQFSIKPFYYLKDINGFYFSSEIKQLFKLNRIEKRINKEYLIKIFGFERNNDYGDLTLFENVKQLKTGHYLIVKNIFSANAEISIEKWHEFNTRPSNFSINEKEASEKFYELFYDSVKLRLRSDVPVGTALSGGIDSSAIVVTMDRILKETGSSDIQKTFTAGSEKMEIDETKYAKQVIELTNAKGYFIEPTADGFINELEKMYYHIETPYISSSCYASWCVYRLAKEAGVTVTLDGQGSDEILAGYDKYMYPYYQTQNLIKGELSQYLGNSKKIKDDYKISYFRQILEISKKELKNVKVLKMLYDENRIKRETIFNNGLKDYSIKLLHEKNDKGFDITGNSMTEGFSNYLKNSFYTLSLPILLNVVDRNSMAHSIEARLPFLDYRLLEFVYSLPHTYKINNGITKYIFKNSFKGLLPKNILNRFKIGFVTSEKEWLSKEINIIKDIIYNSKIIKEFFDIDAINLLFKDVPLNSNKIWKLLSLATILNSFETI